MEKLKMYHTFYSGINQDKSSKKKKDYMWICIDIRSLLEFKYRLATDSNSIKSQTSLSYPSKLRVSSQLLRFSVWGREGPISNYAVVLDPKFPHVWIQRLGPVPLLQHVRAKPWDIE